MKNLKDIIIEKLVITKDTKLVSNSGDEMIIDDLRVDLNIKYKLKNDEFEHLIYALNINERTIKKIRFKYIDSHNNKEEYQILSSECENILDHESKSGKDYVMNLYKNNILQLYVYNQIKDNKYYLYIIDDLHSSYSIYRYYLV